VKGLEPFHVVAVRSTRIQSGYFVTRLSPSLTSSHSFYAISTALATKPSSSSPSELTLVDENSPLVERGTYLLYWQLNVQDPSVLRTSYLSHLTVCPALRAVQDDRCGPSVLAIIVTLSLAVICVSFCGPSVLESYTNALTGQSFGPTDLRSAQDERCGPSVLAYITSYVAITGTFGA